MTNPTPVVAGLGRCGTSLTMQMLHAGGVPCIGAAPDFEVAEVRASVRPAQIKAWRGSAVKVLSPHRVRMPS